MKRLVVADQTYGPTELRDLSGLIVELRDRALANGKMTWAVILSHTIGVLNTLADEIEKEEG